ncbi:hypothetical protein Tco_1458022 [Tanacetum coccineum]
MSGKSSPLKRLIIGINAWVKLPEGENIFTLLQIFMQVTLLLLTAWRESHASRFDQVIPERKCQRAIEHGHVDIPESHGEVMRWLDEEIPRNQIPTLRRDLLGVARFLRWVEAEMVSPEVGNEKWRRFLLHWMYVAFDVSTDGREEDFFPRNGMSW